MRTYDKWGNQIFNGLAPTIYVVGIYINTRHCAFCVDPGTATEQVHRMARRIPETDYAREMKRGK